MRRFNVITNLTFIAMAICACIIGSVVQAQERVTNTNNENVEVEVEEIGEGAQQQGQNAEGGNGEVKTEVIDEDAEDNFWTDSFNGYLSIPPGAASVVCQDQMVSFSRTGGVGLGVGAVGFNFAENSGASPEEFEQSLLAIKQCAREKNIAQIMDKYTKLLEVNKAIANTYLRAVSPELYATFFVENLKAEGEIVSGTSYTNLATNLRNKNFNQIVEWQDNFYRAGIEARRAKLQEDRKLRSTKVQQQLAELEVMELQRKARELDNLLNQKYLDIQQLQNR